jgi:PKD repeat protein
MQGLVYRKSCTLAIVVLFIGASLLPSISGNNFQEFENQLNITNKTSSNLLEDWTEQAKLLASDGAEGDTFGVSVSIDGDYAIIGAYYDNDNGACSGSAYIFKRSGTTWTEQAKLLASDGAEGDTFGVSVSIDGDYAIIGAHGNDDNGDVSGSAYIFKRSETTWTEQAKLLASDGAEDDIFGVSVSIDGDYAIIGACYDSDNGAFSGSAYIFKRSETTWTEQAKLLASDGAEGDTFGVSVSIDGDYAIIGACYDNDNGAFSGSAYIFKRSGTTWTEQVKLLASDGAEDDIFGVSVSIDGDYAIIGAFDDDNGAFSGSAYIFKRSGTTWTEQAKLLASDAAEYDFFGSSVSIDGYYAIIGACYDSDNGAYSAYIFKRSGTTWTEQAKLLASDGAEGFGSSVSIDGYYAIIGACYDSDNGAYSGSAYIFNTIGGNQPPTADFTYTPLNPTDTEIIQFTDTSTDNDGVIVNWTWDFDDGKISYLQNPTHRYCDDGTYHTTLTVKDDDDATDSISKDIIVSNVPPTSYIDSITPNPANIGEEVSFEGHGEDTDGTIEIYYWESSINGPLSTASSFSITALTPGSHFIYFRVQDDDGTWSSFATETLIVNDNNPPNTPTITGTVSGEAGEEYDYTFNSVDPDGDNVQFYIEWGDGNEWTEFLGSGEDITISHTWNAEDDYTIRAKAKDINGAESDWATLEVSMPKNKAINTPFIRFLEQHSHLFPILRQLLGL